MGASPNTRAQPDYKAILQGFYDKQLVKRIAAAHDAAFTNTNRLVWYAEECEKIFNAFAAICMQFSNQKKFGEVYNRQDYLHPIAVMIENLHMHLPYIIQGGIDMEAAKEMIVGNVETTLKLMNPSQTVVSDIQ